MPPALIYSLLLGTVVLLLSVVAVIRVERLSGPVRFMLMLVFAPLSFFCAMNFYAVASGAVYDHDGYATVWSCLFAATFVVSMTAFIRLVVSDAGDSEPPEGD